MKILHGIVTNDNVSTIKPVQGQPGYFESGEWEISAQTATDLCAGGKIMLHEKQKSGSRHGGRVVGYRPRLATRVNKDTGEEREVYLYTLVYVLEDECLNVKFNGGWSQQLAVEVV